MQQQRSIAKLPLYRHTEKHNAEVFKETGRTGKVAECFELPRVREVSALTSQTVEWVCRVSGEFILSD